MALFGRKKKTDDKVEDKGTLAQSSKEVKAPKKAATKSESKTKAVKEPKAKAETKDVPAKAVKAKPADAKAVVGKEGKSDYGYRITEKATRLADKNVYVLNVPKTINKVQLKKDLETKYKVTVININIVNSPKKDKFYKGAWGTRGGGKKAYITLKAGDSIVL
jgi:ribosomal protein L23